MGLLPLMSISETGIALLCEFEGCELRSYLDVVGVHTIGYGTTRINGKPVTAGMTCTLDQAKTWLQQDLRQFESAVLRGTAPVTLTQSQFDGCVVLAYNIGANAFITSTVAKKIRTRRIADVTESNFTAWNKVRNDKNVLVESAGLTRRRKAEYYLFSTGKIKTQF